MYTIKQTVKYLLTTNAETRKDDYTLFAEFIRQNVKRYPLDKELQTFCDVLSNHKEHGLPNFTSIIRARRLLQVENPNLIDATTKAQRTKKESKFKESIRKGEII